MPDRRIALVTGANQGVGLQVARELVAHGLTVFVGSRDAGRGEKAAKEIGTGAIALQLDVTDAASIAAAAERIRKEAGHLDLLVQNAAIAHTGRAPGQSVEEHEKSTLPSNVSLAEVRTVWDTNVFGVLAVHQAMLPLLKKSSDARIVIVSSAVGSLAMNANPAFPNRKRYAPTYAASKTALNGLALAMIVELEGTPIKVNIVTPGFTSTALNNFAGPQTVAEGAREITRVALLGPDGPSGTYTRWENETIPW